MCSVPIAARIPGACDEHAYPVKIIGWLVIVLKCHAEALQELTLEEFAELAQIQAKAVHALHKENLFKPLIGRRFQDARDA